MAPARERTHAYEGLQRMPIIATIGRRHYRVRLLIVSVYIVLMAGSITMVYPFLIMVAGSTQSSADSKEFGVVPRFLIDDVVLYRKYVEGLFNESVTAMKCVYDIDEGSFEVLMPPTNPNETLLGQWRQFLRDTQLPFYTRGYGFMDASIVAKTMPQNMRTFKQQLATRFGGDLDATNQAMGTNFRRWYDISLRPESFLLRREKPLTTPISHEFRKFAEGLPSWSFFYFSVEGFYKTLFLKTQYTKDIAEYNRQHGTTYNSYDQVHLPRRLPPTSEEERDDWLRFLRRTLNLFWIRADDSAAPLYRNYLKAKYAGIEAVNDTYEKAYGSFDEIPLIREPPVGGAMLSDWEDFVIGWEDQVGILHILPAEMIRIESVEFLFRDYLQHKYGDIMTLNNAVSTNYRDFVEILAPQQDWHYVSFLQVRGKLRWEFTTRNFKRVIDYLVRHGRGVVNTVMYCALSVVLALIVNPLAGYAISRHKLPSSYKILLFLMLTMAFPPMVTQIPVFLMLRNLGLLNSFAALVLPGLANGYSIFLLKGFFDSLPRELYESAALDGAGEWRMFWQITMSLSKPILAVIALSAFIGAYSNFMYALLICQDEKMWTLMVWLYQLQQRSGHGVIYASLIIAAIPTLVIFMFCQNIIMRGIVVPVEK